MTDLSFRQRDLTPQEIRLGSLLLAGWSEKQIKAELSLSSADVAKAMNDPLFITQLKRRQKEIEAIDNFTISQVIREVSNELHRACMQALQTQIDLLTDGTPEVRFKASQALLDRAFKVVPNNITIANTNTFNLSPEQTQLLQTVVAECGPSELIGPSDG